MRKIVLLLALLSPAVYADAVRVEQLDWLAGCWGFDTDNGRYEEIWSRPTGNNIVGMSRRIEDGFAREFEFMRIVTSGGGGFDFIALPQGENETRFNSLSVADRKLVFDNPDNPFPSRIIYEHVPPDALNARIEGTADGRAMGINFPMKRRPCP